MGLHHQENQDLICVPTLGFSVLYICQNFPKLPVHFRKGFYPRITLKIAIGENGDKPHNLSP